MIDIIDECPFCKCKEFEGIRKQCKKCGHGDRTRALHYSYQPFQSLMAARSALIFTSESWLTSAGFARCERSLFNGSNHLDIQSIDRPDESFSWIACNHVLEHVEDDRKALRECFRILANNGVLQITVPMPGHCSQTTDWGFSDPSKFGHLRNYGADFLARLSEELPSGKICVQIVQDKLTSFHDVSFLVCKDEGIRRQISDAIFRAHELCVVVP